MGLLSFLRCYALKKISDFDEPKFLGVPKMARVISFYALMKKTHRKEWEKFL
jgi:hypothetical protein